MPRRFVSVGRGEIALHRVSASLIATSHGEFVLLPNSVGRVEFETASNTAFDPPATSDNVSYVRSQTVFSAGKQAFSRQTAWPARDSKRISDVTKTRHQPKESNSRNPAPPRKQSPTFLHPPPFFRGHFFRFVPAEFFPNWRFSREAFFDDLTTEFRPFTKVAILTTCRTLFHRQCRQSSRRAWWRWLPAATARARL